MADRDDTSYLVLLAAAAIAMMVSLPATAAPDAAGASSSTDKLGEIVVTATRREQSLQVVPAAVTAVTGTQLVESGVNDVRDIGLIAPGATFREASVPGNAVFQIRGQVQVQVAPTIDPSVGVYFDDVYIARANGGLTNFVDISRVEVLRGPQGTLFGKNTTGGAVRIISNRPELEKLDGHVSFSHESFNRNAYEGVINLPIGTTAAVRFVGQYVKKDSGFATNTVSGNPIDTAENTFGRASFRFDPTDKLSVLIEGDYFHVNSGAPPAYLANYQPQNDQGSALEVAFERGLWNFTPAGIPAAFGAGVPILLGAVQTPDQARHGVGNDLRASTASSYTFNPVTSQYAFVGGRVDPTIDSKTSGGSVNISYDLGFATLHSITAYRKVDLHSVSDIDGTAFYILDVNHTSHDSQFSQELLLHGSAFDKRLDWTGGALYFHENPYQNEGPVATSAVQAIFNQIIGQVTGAQAKNDSIGVFASGDYAITDQLSLGAGLRFTHEKRDDTAFSFVRTLDSSFFCAYTPANKLSTIPAFQSPCSIVQSVTANEPSYNVSLKYQIDNDKQVYVRTGRSFRSGGFTSQINAPEVVAPFKAEITTDYELGVKATWLDDRLQTNLAVFHSNTKDAQLTVNSLSPSTGQVISPTINIGDKKVNGAELEIVARPIRMLTLNAAVTYLDAKTNNPTTPDVDWSSDTPKVAFNLGALLDVPVTDSFSAKARVDLSHRDEMFAAGGPLRGPTGQIIFTPTYPSLTLVNARLGLVHTNSGAELSVYSNNLTNKNYASTLSVVSGLGITIGQLAEPRVVGVRLDVPFGKH